MVYLMVYDMHLFYLIGDACGVCGVYVGVCVHHVVFFDSLQRSSVHSYIISMSYHGYG